MLHDILTSLDFQQCCTDSCLYIKNKTDGKTLVGIYGDDTLVTGTSARKVKKFFGDMKMVELKDPGVFKKFLGSAEAAPVRTPICREDSEEEGALQPIGSKASPRGPTVQVFQSLVGSLLWIARCTRPDIAFAVHRATRRSHAPREGDWLLAKRIAKYLKGTKGITFRMAGDKDANEEESVLVEAYSDADYAADKTDRKSVTGGALMVSGILLGGYAGSRNVWFSQQWKLSL
uniref:Yokozuna putative n=1 Tax=Albugo laibachii Nc14 TaxID=890382 RepID=F0WHA6_9STRA|nr:Yokozuna putative [Albugo laibachii Nc14]|eukprot:CCA20622.1 Yokozuna putative [Albugo laibachii Nc14]